MSDPRDQAVHFGPYRIHPHQRLVLEAGRPLRLGRRAVDILLILLEQAGNVVSKQELIARVWPKSVVEDGNLRVHMAALRKALGDGQAGQRYIVTVAQRGYSFVAPYSLEQLEQPATHPASTPGGHNLPLRRTRMIGRQSLVDNLVTQLPRQRFITLVGPGGIGKTTVALRVAEQLIGRYRDGILLLDLAPINKPSMIAPHLASLLELSLHDDDPIRGIATFLRDRQMLLVIDNCEHLIDAITLLSESLLRAAPQVHVLATSRESLRAEGEFVHHLQSGGAGLRAELGRARQAAAGEDVLLDEVGALDVAVEQGVLDHDALDAGAATRLEQAGHALEVGRPVLAAHGFDHLDRADGVERFVADVAVVLQAQVGAIGPADAGHAFAGEVELLGGEGHAGDAGVELQRGLLGQRAPTAADLEHPVTRLHAGHAQGAPHLGVLCGKSVVLLSELA